MADVDAFLEDVAQDVMKKENERRASIDEREKEDRLRNDRERYANRRDRSRDRNRESNGRRRSRETEHRRRDGSRPRSSKGTDTDEDRDRTRRHDSRDRHFRGGRRGGRGDGGGDYYSGGGRQRSRSPRRDRDRDRDSKYRERNRSRDRRGGRDERSAPRHGKTVSPEVTEDDRDKRTIFVQQISQRAHTSHLLAFFETVGPVIEAQIVKDRVTGRSKGYVIHLDLATIILTWP